MALALSGNGNSKLSLATLKQINVTSMFKLNKNTNETSKNIALWHLQLTLNTFNILIQCSIQTCAPTTQINSTIYHSLASCQLLGAPQNTSPTGTCKSFHDPTKIPTFKIFNQEDLNWIIQLLQLLSNLFFFLMVCKNRVWVLLQSESPIQVQFLNDVSILSQAYKAE